MYYNDLISRKKVLDSLNVFSDRKHGNEHFLIGIDTAKEIVEKVQPEYNPNKFSQKEKKILRVINTLKTMNIFYASFSDRDRSDALSYAINYLYKFIPQFVLNKDNLQGDFCPTCDILLPKKIDKFCPHCGQRIKYRRTCKNNSKTS